VRADEANIQTRVPGIHVGVQDCQAIGKAQYMLLSDATLATQCGQAARATVEQRYSLEHITDVYIELYQSMITPQITRVEHLSPSESYTI